jgi:hypothetical protein
VIDPLIRFLLYIDPDDGVDPLSRFLLYTDPDDGSVGYVLPWFVRELRPAGDGTLILLDSFEHPGIVAVEGVDVIAQRLLDCQTEPAE